MAFLVASSLPPERLRPNDDRWNAARSCQFLGNYLVTSSEAIKANWLIGLKKASRQNLSFLVPLDEAQKFVLVGLVRWMRLISK